MNIQNPNPSIRRIATPVLSSEILVRLSSEPNAAEAARNYAGKSFDQANGDPATMKGDCERAKKQLQQASKEAARADQRLARTPEARSFPTNQILKPLSLTRLAVAFIGCIVIMLDIPLTLYTAGSYLASSGRLDTLANDTLAATVFCFVFVAGVYGLKAIGDLRPTDQEKVRFATSLLSVGAISLVCFAIGFAILFNPASAEAPAGPLGAPMTPLDWRIAAGLVFTQLMATVSLGAGISLFVTRAIDENKVHHQIRNLEFAQAARAADDIKARCHEQESTVASLTAYLATHAHERAAFVSLTESRVLGICSYVHAKASLARHEVQSQLMESRAAIDEALENA